MKVQKGGWYIHLFRKSVHISPGRMLVYLFVMALVLFTALPLIYMVCTAFKPIDELLHFPPLFFVHRPTSNNFRDLLLAAGGTSVPFLRYILNSLYVSVATVALNTIVSALGAYSLVKLALPFKKPLFALVVAALMFPTQITTIPNYLVVNELRMMNTYWALIIPKIATAFGFFLIKQFCEQLPDALLEAARIDGASEWKIFWRIVFPFMIPACSTLVVFSFVGSWNDAFSPMVYITDESMRTLPLALQSIGTNTTLARAGAMAAATMLATVPTILIYVLMQRKVIATMAYSGIK